LGRTLVQSLTVEDPEIILGIYFLRTDDSEIISCNNAGAIIDKLNEECYFKAINKINKILEEDPFKRRKRIRDVAIKYRSFEIAEKVYKEIYA